MDRSLIIKKRKSFIAIAKTKLYRSSDSLVVQYTHSVDLCWEGSSSIRFGITVSKKVGNAVVRNKAKRRIKEVLRKLLVLQNSITQGFSYVIIARSAAKSSNYHDIKRDLEYCFRKIKQKILSSGEIKC